MENQPKESWNIKWKLGPYRGTIGASEFAAVWGSGFRGRHGLPANQHFGGKLRSLLAVSVGTFLEAKHGYVRAYYTICRSI